MIPFDLKAIESVMKLMAKHRIDEYASDHFTLKRSDHRPKPPLQRTRKGAKPREEPEEEKGNPDAPWEAIPTEALERFAINGKLGA